MSVNSRMRELNGVLGDVSTHRNVLVAATLGWVLDAFDFSILVFLIPVLGKEFGVALTAMALVTTATLIAKVIGNIGWGVWADRVGRRLPFAIGVLWFAVFSGLSGLAWMYGALLVIRFIFGLGFGGQWSAAAPLLMESVPERARGLTSGIMMAGWEVGYLLAALAYAVVYPALGWRWMFFLGVLPALLVFFIIKKVPESPVAHRAVEKRAVFPKPDAPAVQGWAFMGAINFLSYAIFGLYPTFLITVRHYSPAEVFPFIAAYSAASVIGKPICGQLASRFGERPTAIVYMIVTIPSTVLYTLSPSVFATVIGAILIGLFANGIFGIVPAYLSRRFPVEVRSAGMGTGYAVAGVTGALAPYLVAVFTKQFGLGLSMAGFIVIGALVSIVAVAFKTRTYGAEAHPEATTQSTKQAAT